MRACVRAGRHEACMSVHGGIQVCGCAIDNLYLPQKVQHCVELELVYLIQKVNCCYITVILDTTMGDRGHKKENAVYAHENLKKLSSFNHYYVGRKEGRNLFIRYKYKT